MLRGLFLITFALLFFINVLADNPEWKPVTPVELAMKTPQVEPDSDVEAIFWEVRLDDKKGGNLSYNHYIRVKIFTERGREKYSKFDIPFTKGKKIEDIAARVIKPDGSIIELNPNDIFEREIFKSKKFKIQAKSFAIPSIEVGVIVEYQYKETFKGDSLNDERLPLQRDIPVQRLTYYVRPYQNLPVGFKFYNTQEFTFTPDTDNFYRGTVTNVPAFKEEDQMPPEDEARPWVLLKYRSSYSDFSWSFFGLGASQYFTEAIKPSKEIQQKANELTNGISSNEEKLKRIYEFTQKQIRNISFDRSFTDEQRENFKLKNPTDALKNKVGNSQYIDLLFASLAKAAGFNPYLVLSADRSQHFFTQEKYPIYSFVHPCCIAVVADGNTYKYFNPGTPYLPFGNIIWYEETAAMFVSETGNTTWRIIPLTPPEVSLAKRTGKFNLLDDGTLEGDVRTEYYGQRAISRRQEHYQDSPTKREDEIKDDVKKRLSLAEVTNISVENFDDNSKPLVYSYKVRIPNYAQKTGKRIFLQPGFFEYGEKPLFTANDRIHPMYFEYGWSDQDEIEISLPSNYLLEASDAPAPVRDAAKRVTGQTIKITVNDDKTLLKYDRNFHFGDNGNVLFMPKFYQPIKALFDSFHKADSHTITLRQK
ncbi:MAG: DUF3857 and transglutaminase domain-containing protein [Pyrinomonadaceae bacterium]|nr:DUF3857 and transglutaminase domain-containing protein [Pyrinomonadaceae bacterium]